jgi:hypothetical protein
MKKCAYVLLWMLMLGLTFQAFAQVPGWQWAKSSGGSGRDEAELVAVDPLGNVYICGKFSDTAWFSTSWYMISKGGVDIYLAKYDAQGNVLQAHSLGSTMDAEGLSIAADHLGNVAITGYFKGNLTNDTMQFTGQPGKDNFFVAYFSSTSFWRWVKVATGGNIRGKGIEFDAAGNVLVTGHYEDSLVIGSTVLQCQGLQNAFLMKFDDWGTLQWATYGGGQYNAWASSVGVDSQGNAYITGAFKDTAWFGTHQIVTYGLNDVFLAKCNPLGNWIWARNAGGTSDDYGNGIEVDAYDHIAVTGSFFGTVSFPPAPAITSYGGKDGFIAYYDPMGNGLWAHPFGGTGEDKGIGVSTDNIGNVYVTGFIKGLGSFGPIQKPSAGNDDVCLAKYTRTGQILWADVAGGTANDYGKGIQVSQQGVAYVAGYFEGTSLFGPTTLVSKGGRESFIAKYQDGTPQISQQPLSQNLCVGDSLILSVVAAGTNLSYAWFKDGVQLPGQINPTYAIHCPDTLPTGKYTCIISTLSGYAITDTAVVNIDHYPTVDIGPAYHLIHASQPLTLDAGPGHAHYLWSTGDTTQLITYYGYEYVQILQYNPFIIKVIVTSMYGCSASDSAEVQVVASIDNLNNGEGFTASLNPNPANESVKVISDTIMDRIELLTLTGKVLFTAVDHADAIVIPLNGVPAGIYLVRVFAGNKVSARRLVVL